MASQGHALHSRPVVSLPTATKSHLSTTNRIKSLPKQIPSKKQQLPSIKASQTTASSPSPSRPRASSRTTNSSPSSPPSSPPTDPKSSSSSQDSIRCVCSKNSESGHMIQCEECSSWLHSKCVGITRSCSSNFPFCVRNVFHQISSLQQELSKINCSVSSLENSLNSVKDQFNFVLSTLRVNNQLCASPTSVSQDFQSLCPPTTLLLFLQYPSLPNLLMPSAQALLVMVKTHLFYCKAVLPENPLTNLPSFPLLFSLHPSFCTIKILQPTYLSLFPPLSSTIPPQYHRNFPIYPQPTSAHHPHPPHFAPSLPLPIPTPNFYHSLPPPQSSSIQLPLTPPFPQPLLPLHF